MKSMFSALVSATLISSVICQTISKLQNTRYLGNLNASTYMQPYGGTIRIGAPISMDSGDAYVTQALQIIGGWEMFLNYVNLERSPPGIFLNNKYWDLELQQIEDYSSTDYVTYTTQQMLDGKTLWNGITPDFYFAPYGSSLTQASLTQTEAAGKNLFASTSSSTSVWTSSIQYGFTSLYASNTWYNPGLNYYYSAGARTACFICNNNANSGNTCGFGGSSQTDITNTFAASGIQLTGYYELDPALSTYETDLANVVSEVAADDTDIVVIMDYDSICSDFPPQAQTLDWTPNAMMLVFCGNNADTISAMGTNVYYASTYTAWSPQATYTSGISGTTNAQFASDFEQMFNTPALYQAAEGYACGEILLSAIEDTQSLDPTTIATNIEQGSFSTILSPSPLTFPSRHQAVGDWLALQFDTTGNTYILSGISNLVYPMPAWADRSSVTTATASPSTNSASDNSNNDDDSYTKAQAGALAMTAIFCWIGGILTAFGLLVAVPKYTGYGIMRTSASMATKEAEMSNMHSSSA